MATDILAIEEIIRDDVDFKVRSIDPATIAAYAEVVDRLPAVEVWQEDGLTYLLDGGHRIEARLKRGLAEVQVFYFRGTREEAEARARSANLAHNAFQLTGDQRRQAHIDVLLRLYEYNNKWLADEYLFCSPNTVASLRAQLEEEGRIPALAKFKRRDGVEAKRAYDKRQPPDEPTGEDREEEVDEDGMDAAGAGEPDKGAKGEGQDHKSAPMSHGGEMGLSDGGVHRQQPLQQTTIRLAQVGEALGAEVVMHVDRKPFGLPVTLLITEGALAGVPEVSPDHKFVLIISRTQAQDMGLIVDNQEI